LYSSEGWVIVSFMEHLPTTENDDQKVYRIARELAISLEDAALTCAGFELAFSDERMRRAIFEIIDRLDYEAYKKGEPLGMILSYAVELGNDGIHVTRHADEIPPGQVVSLTPTNRAMIFLKINDNFPTQQFLGPLIVNRPELPSVSVPRRGGFSTGQSGWPQPTGVVSPGVCPTERDGLISDIDELPFRAGPSTGQSYGQNEGWQADGFCRADGVVCSDSEMKKPAIPLGPSSLELARQPIYLGPIRLTFNQRFPRVSATRSSSQLAALQAGNLAFHSKALNPPHHLPPWAALPAGMPAFQSMSGLSPPTSIGDLGHSDSKDVHRPTANRRERHVSHILIFEN
jgi:hypothetical protein